VHAGAAVTRSGGSMRKTAGRIRKPTCGDGDRKSWAWFQSVISNAHETVKPGTDNPLVHEEPSMASLMAGHLLSGTVCADGKRA